MSADKETNDILDAWYELDGQLRSKGIVIEDSGAKNAIILAFAKCYSLGKEKGASEGFVEAMERIVEKAETWRTHKQMGFILTD